MEVTVVPAAPFDGAVALSLEAAPAGVSGAFEPASTPAASSLTLRVAPGAEVGVHPLTVRGRADPLEASAALQLEVRAAPGRPAPVDTTPPTVLATESTSNTTVTVAFSEVVTGTDDAARFTISPELPVAAAIPSVDGRSVTLTTAPQTNDESYTVQISPEVTDLAGNAYRPGDDAPAATTFLGVGQPVGTLRVNVLGLPEGANADIEVTGPDGFRKTVTGSSDLTGLTTGIYDFSVNPVSPDSATFVRRDGPATLSFDAGAGATATFTYACRAVRPPDAGLNAALKQALGKSTYTCANLRELTELDASGRAISNLEGLQYAVGLTHLDLGRNELGGLPDGLFDRTPALTRLYLNQNQLGGLPDGLFDHTPVLTDLDLSDNRLAGLPRGLFDATPLLTVLYLNQNQLGSLPSGLFDATPALTDLALDHNRLAGLPRGLFDRTAALTFLALDHNRIGRLPDRLFDHTPFLTDLDLSYNQLERLPDGLFHHTPALTNLDLDENRLAVLAADAFHATTALTRLFLSGNCLQPTKVPTRGILAALDARTVTFDAAPNPAPDCPASPPPQPPVWSTFDEDTEGWTVTGDGENLEHVGSGGAQGGFVRARDGGQGGLWYWKAPALYHGDATDYLGAKLEFFLRQSATDNSVGGVGVRFTGPGGRRLEADIAPPGRGWTAYRIPLAPATFGATPGELEQVFSDLRSIEIRGEYRSGDDTGGLDSVTFGAP